MLLNLLLQVRCENVATVYVDHYSAGVINLGQYKMIYFNFEPNQDAVFINYRPQDCTIKIINNATKEEKPCLHEIVYIKQTNSIILKLESIDYDSKALVPYAAMSCVRGHSDLLYVLADPYQDFYIKYFTDASNKDVPFRENERISIFVPSIYSRSFGLSCNTSSFLKASIRYLDINKNKDITQNLKYTTSFISQNEMYGFVIDIEVKDIPDKYSYIKFQNANSPAANYYNGRANLSIFKTGSYGNNLYISEYENNFNKTESMCLCLASECLFKECPNSLPIYNLDKIKDIILSDRYSFNALNVNIYTLGESHIDINIDRPNLFISFQSADQYEPSINLNLITCPMSLTLIGMKAQLTINTQILSFETFYINCSSFSLYSSNDVPSLIASKFGGDISVRKFFSSITVRTELIISQDYLNNDFDFVLPKSILITIPETIKSIIISESGLTIPNSKISNIPIGGIGLLNPSNSSVNAAGSKITNVKVNSDRPSSIHLFGLPPSCALQVESSSELNLSVDSPVPFAASGSGKVRMDVDTARNADPSASGAFVELSLKRSKKVVLKDEYVSVDGLKVFPGQGGLALIADGGAAVLIQMAASAKLPPVSLRLTGGSGALLGFGFKSFRGDGTLNITATGRVSIRSAEKPPLRSVRVLMPDGEEAGGDCISQYEEMWSATPLSAAYLTAFILVLLVLVGGVLIIFLTPVGKELGMPTFGPFAEPAVINVV